MIIRIKPCLKSLPTSKSEIITKMESRTVLVVIAWTIVVVTNAVSQEVRAQVSNNGASSFQQQELQEHRRQQQQQVSSMELQQMLANSMELLKSNGYLMRRRLPTRKLIMSQKLQQSWPDSVMNNNHATYVMPPADFKPIIYESSRVPKFAHKRVRPPCERSSRSNTILCLLDMDACECVGLPTSRPSSQQSTVSMLSTRSVNADDIENDVAEESNLKVSIDRWSDWHDVPVDLASSESQHVPSSYLPVSKMSLRMVQSDRQPPREQYNQQPYLQQQQYQYQHPQQQYPQQQHPQQQHPQQHLQQHQSIQQQQELHPQQQRYQNQQKQKQQPVTNGKTTTNIFRATSNTSSTPIVSSASTKRSAEKRRIRTLLPVGLSSWLLGGIRDLDARHWKLPNEVISKLAINDVDLKHPESDSWPEQPTIPPSVPSVVNVRKYKEH